MVRLSVMMLPLMQLTIEGDRGLYTPHRHPPRRYLSTHPLLRAPNHHPKTYPPFHPQTADSTWFLPQPPTSASPLILDLNGDLIKIDTTTSAYLGGGDCAFLKPWPC